MAWLDLSEDYWDCECDENYIHPNSQNKCDLCGALQEEQPPSRANEVLEAMKNNLKAVEDFYNGIETPRLKQYGIVED